MKLTILPDKHLEVALSADDDADEVRGWGHEWWHMFEEAVGKGWGTVAPEWIGAMTAAPMVTDGYTVHDDGESEVFGQVWWFPNYMVENPVETLATKGRVVFTFAPTEAEETAR